MKTSAAPVKDKSELTQISYSKVIAQFKDRFAKFVIFVGEARAAEFEQELRALGIGLRTFDLHRNNRPAKQQDIILGEFSRSKTGILVTTLSLALSNWRVVSDAAIFVNCSLHIEASSGPYNRYLARVKTDQVIFLDCTFGDNHEYWKKERRIEDVSPSIYGLPENVSVSRRSVDRRADDAFTEMVRARIPQHAAVCEGPAEEAVFHHKDFGSGYHKDDIAMIGTVVKYAGLRGKAIRFVPDSKK